MQRFKQILRRFLLWIGAVALTIGASGCARGDRESYGMPTDVERLFTTAEQLQTNATSTFDYNLPDGNYQWDFLSDDGSLNVSVDAPVTAPEAPLLLVRAAASGFTQSQITGIYRCLFDGQTATMLIGKNVQTKTSVQEQLDQMKQVLRDEEYSDYGFTKEEYEEAIRRQEAAYADAPAVSAGERVSTDGTMLTIRDDSQGDYQALDARTNAGDTLVVRSAPESDRSQLPSACRFDRYNAPEYNMLGAALMQEGDALPPYAQGKLTISYDQAKRVSDALLAAAGTDTTLLAAYVVGDGQTGNTDGLVQEAVHYAYRFAYERKVNNVPVATDAWTQDSGESEVPWQYEQINVLVDDEGIAQVRWIEPIVIQDEETDTASIVPFPQAREIFEKMIPIVYSPQTDSANPKIDQIRLSIGVSAIHLSLLRVENPSAASKSGLLVPAWVFYGDIVSQTIRSDGTAEPSYHRQGMHGAEGNSFAPGPTIVLAINAVDGSVIDTSQGY